MRCWLSILVAAALFISICTAVTTMYLCTAVETSLQTQQGVVNDYVHLTERVARLEQKNAELEEQNQKLAKQLDFIAAAARMGWSDAYRFLRSIRSESNEETQGTIDSQN